MCFEVLEGLFLPQEGVLYLFKSEDPSSSRSGDSLPQWFIWTALGLYQGR